MKVYSDYLKYVLIIGAIIGAASITACSSSSSPAAAPTTLSGTAAAGAPIIGTVTVKGSLGNTKSALIEANGNYDVDVTGLTAPYRLRAQGTVGGRTYKLHSYAQEADVGGNVNITPFTDLIVANAASQIAESYFNSLLIPVEITQDELDTQEDALQAKLQDVFTALGVDSAINLLNSTFSADHTGLDAALDVVNIEFSTGSNIATITNLIENTTTTDDFTDQGDAGTLPVNDPNVLTAAVSDTQQIVALFDEFTAAFANSIPSATSIENIFTVDFLELDQSRGELLTELTTDLTLVGLGFSGLDVNIIDATNAEVNFNFSVNGVLDFEVANWFAVKDPSLGWQLDGDRIPVDYWFNFHCNDGSGTGNGAGACGVNTMIEDNIFQNNGTFGDAAFASGTVSIFAEGDDTSIATPKAVIHLGTRSNDTGGSAGRLEVYNGGTGFADVNDGFSGDWKPFGTGTTTADISSAIFAANDIIQYDLYTEQLVISDTTTPAIDVSATPAFSFTRTSPFAPSTTPLYPDATTATITAIDNYTLDNDLDIAWILEDGTRNSEVLVSISDSNFNRFETWIETFGTTTTSTTFSGSELSTTAATGVGLDDTATTYNLLVRIYAEDETTGQAHSRDYTATIPGPGAGGPAATIIPISAASLPGTYTWNVNAGEGRGDATFNFIAGGTGTVHWPPEIQELAGHPGYDDTIVWSIDTEGRIEAVITGVDFSVDYDRYTLTSGTLSDGVMQLEVKDTPASVYVLAETYNWVESVATTLACNYESTWDDIADQPAVFNSYDDFEEVVTACGGAIAIDAASITGIWDDTYTDIGTYVETLNFNANGTGVYTETLDGIETVDSGIGFDWSVAGNRLTLTVAGQYMEVMAQISPTHQVYYSQDASWIPPSDLSITNTTQADGEIWHGGYVKR